MPTYHLHLHNQHIDADDVVGHDLPGLDAAREMAFEGIRDLLGHEAFNGTIDFRGYIDIEDENGVVLETIPFRDAITLIGR